MASFAPEARQDGVSRQEMKASEMSLLFFGRQDRLVKREVFYSEETGIPAVSATSFLTDLCDLLLNPWLHEANCT